MVDTQTDEVLEGGEESGLLDFSEPLRRTVGVAPNGEAYEVRSADEFGIEDEHLLRAKRERFIALQQKKKLTAVERAEYAATLSDLFERIVVAPQSVKDCLNDRQKQKIVLFFTAAQLGEEAELTAAAVKIARRETDSTSES